ncbi:sensor histidine kinase [Streptomyces formicae]|uniref:histidine kinase n=1 Tax=Streptomyces formicae TaxID=1616117 RepID=A0ABY3WJ60_9ACTN|nr:ATP-binding protein [Streptomyces formicae]UNM12628.1 sensor histidine kinase [Streptomyces formicae]
MSQLRAPAARPDRREGGRHGRSGSRSASAAGRPQTTPPTPESRIRPQLLRTAVLPAVVASISGAAAVLFTIRSTDASPSAALWVALAGSAALAVAAVAAAALGADRTARSVLDRAHALRRSSARGQADLRVVVEGLRRGERPQPRREGPPPAPAGDEFDLLAHELTRSYDAAVTAVVQASRLSSSVGNEQKVEVFVNLARRLQSLVHREIQLLDELENEVEDPELLKGLFHVDHLATRIRRHAENLAVLGGAISRRQWSNPVTMTEVLRSSIAEVEQYPRVKLVPPIDGTLRGHAVADVIHLLAELVENATLFSAPHTQVLLRASHVTAGLAVEVEDRGLGMPLTEQHKMNALLADPDQVNVAHLLQDGRIGLFVVSALARRHGIAVRLQSNIYGGIQAVLVLPQGLLGTDHAGQSGGEQSDQHQAVPQAAPQAAPAAAPAPQPAAVAAPVAQPATVAAAHPSPAAEVTHGGPQRSLTYVTTGPGIPHQPPPVDAIGTGDVSGNGNGNGNGNGHGHGHGRLPVRGEHAERPNPAAAPPGVAHTDRQPGVPQPAVPQPGAAQSGVPQTAIPQPSHTTSEIPVVRGTMGRPQLPKRRAQEHLVPQLRNDPAPRRTDEQTLHDPGLMAAFQRGIGLAESQSPAGSHEPLQQDDTHKE